MTAINIQDRNFWLAYVTSAQVEARKALGDPVDLSRMSRAGRDRVHTWVYAPTFVDRSWNWNTYHVRQAAPAAPQTEEERQREREKYAAVIGSIIAVVAGFFAGVVWSGYRNRSEALEKAEATRVALDRLPEDTGVCEQDKGRFTDFAWAAVQVNKLAFSREQAKLRTTVSFLGSGVLLAAGGLASLPFLITAGQVALVASALYGAIQLGLHFGEGEELSSRYGNLQRRAKLLAEVLMQPPAPVEVDAGFTSSSSSVNASSSPLNSAAAAPSAPPAEQVFSPEDYAVLFGDPPGGPRWVPAQIERES